MVKNKWLKMVKLSYMLNKNKSGVLIIQTVYFCLWSEKEVIFFCFVQDCISFNKQQGAQKQWEKMIIVFITLRQQEKNAFSSVIFFCGGRHLLVFATFLKGLRRAKINEKIKMMQENYVGCLISQDMHLKICSLSP